MNTKVPNIFINQLKTLFLFKLSPILIMKQLILLLIVAFYSASISAQVERQDGSPQVMEVNSFIASLKPEANNLSSRKSVNPAAQNLENLLYKVQPSIYFDSGNVKTYGEKPKNFFVDARSLNKISNSNLLKNNIEIVTIKINSATELSSTIDLSVFSSFKNLKYIYIVSSVSTTDVALSKMILNYDEKYSIFYKVEKGDTNQ